MIYGRMLTRFSKRKLQNSIVSMRITTLKRSVDNRLKLLNEIYKFRNIPINDKPSDILEIMGYLGIIRPL